MKLNKYNEYEIELPSTIFEKIRFSIYRNELLNLNEFSIAGIRFVKMKEEEKLMTREEFKNKFIEFFHTKDNSFPSSKERQEFEAERMAKWYEALGLIKFKEEKKDEERILIDCLDGFIKQTKIQNIIKALESIGYTVKKNG